MKRNKTLISVRLHPETVQVVKDLAEKLGVAQANIIEMSVRKFAQSEGVTFPDKSSSNSGLPVTQASLCLFN